MRARARVDRTQKRSRRAPVYSLYYDVMLLLLLHRLERDFATIPRRIVRR